MQNLTEIYEVLDLVTLKRKVALPVMELEQAPGQPKVLTFGALIGTVIRRSPDTWLMDVIKGIEFNRDGTHTEWNVGGLKADYIMGPARTTDHKANTKAHWGLRNRIPRRIEFATNNVDAETTVTRQ